MLIDIHAHCRKKRHPKLVRMDGSHSPTPERLIEMMDEQGIDKSVVLSGAGPECCCCEVVTTHETREMCAQYPDRLIPFCNLDPRYLTNDTRADFRPMLEAYKEMGCKGIGEYDANIPFDDPLNMNLFRQVEEVGLPLIFHVGPKIGGCYGCVDEAGLPRFERVLMAFPGLIFLGHSQPFWAEISTGVIENGERVEYPSGKVVPGRLVELMRKYPSLHGDLSAGSGFGAISRDPEFGCAFMEEFQDRLYFGTDVCNDPQENPIVAYFQKLDRDRLISREAWEKITWRNANRLLGLGLDEQA